MRGLEVVYEASEIISGASKKLPERAAVLKLARMGEFHTIIVSRLDRFGRSLVDMLAVFTELRSIGVNFVSVEDGIDFSTPAGQLQANLLAVIAEFERGLIRERTEEGRQAARNRGVKFGRKGKVSDEMEQEIVRLLSLGETQASLAAAFGLHRSVVFRIKEKHKEKIARKSPQEVTDSGPIFEYSPGGEKAAMPQLLEV